MCADDPDDEIETWNYPAYVPPRPPCTGNPPRWWRQHSRADRNRMRRGGGHVRASRGAVRGNWYAPPPMRLSRWGDALKRIYKERHVAPYIGGNYHNTISNILDIVRRNTHNERSA